MGADRIRDTRGTVDYRLTLARNLDRIEAVLSLLVEDPTLAPIRHEFEPDWAAIESGLDVLQNPEAFAGEGLLFAGIELGRAAFGPAILEEILRPGENSTVRVWLSPDEYLAHLPWEAAYIATRNIEGRLSTHPGIHLLREVPAERTSTRRNGREVRVLIVWADPASERYARLHGIQSELRSARAALEAPECRRFAVRELPYASPAALKKYLEDWPPDILHFIGHGDCVASGSALVLESGEQHVEALIYAEDLAQAVHKAGVRWVVLSGCLTGVAASGMGAVIASNGAEAVVAMQAPISDSSAGLFARAFYGTIGEGTPIEEAVRQGRSAIQGAGNDWAVPALFKSFVPQSEVEEAADIDSEPRVERHNLTFDSRPFIGRVKETAEIASLVRLKGCRLVTITGMGGMGKTRIGKQVALDLLDDFPDGVRMVECEALGTREALIGAIGAVVGAYISFGDAEKTLANAIGERKMLLLLDCFEAIAPHADVIDRLIRSTPNCQVLVTSRKVLDIQAEWEYRLSPMTIGKRVKDASDSIKLFEQAAGHVRHDFRIDSKNRAMVRELCVLLEGVPLALTLAAGRLKSLSLSEILEQVKANPLLVLKRKGPARDRHADMYRVVFDSFRLLDPEELKLMDLLSLFVGGFGIEDASEVCGFNRAEMQDGLSNLRDNSLVQVQLQADRARYKLLDTVREYTDQMPRDDEAVRIRHQCAERHAIRYSRTAVEIGKLIKDGKWNEGSELMWSEIGNLRASFAFCARETRHEMVREFAYGLVLVLFETNLYEDFEKLSTAGHAAAEALDDLVLEARILGLEGAVAAIRKERERCKELWTRRFEICQQLGDASGAADSLIDMAAEEREQGRYEEARALLGRGLEIASKAGNLALMATCLIREAQTSIRENKIEQAKQLAAEAERLAHEARKNESTLAVFQILATVHEQMEDMESARRFAGIVLKEALDAYKVRAICWASLFFVRACDLKGEHELEGRVCFASYKLNREIPTSYAERCNVAWAKYSKRHPAMAQRISVDHKKTPWAQLLSDVA